MKKTISTILNVLSYIATAILGIFAAFCIYDWIKFANTVYAYTPEFWMAMDDYARLMLWASGIGVIFPIINFAINFKDEANVDFKNKAKPFFAILVVGLIISIVLYILPVNFNFNI